MMATGRKFNFHGGQKGVALAIRVTPRSSKNEIAEIQSDGTIKIRLTAPPVDGRANAGLIEFLSGVLEIPPSNLEIVAGSTGRDKLVSVLGLDAETAHQRILKRMG
jgi:uncharacterized protein (TIGR00251 family)